MAAPPVGKRRKMTNDPRMTGVSETTAPFLAVAGSPFTAMRDLPGGLNPQCPKPEGSVYTRTYELKARIQVPVAASGQLLIVCNPNPLAGFPLLWSSMLGGVAEGEVGPGTQGTYLGPHNVLLNYKDTQLVELITKAHELVNSSAAYRIVGCGVRANLTAPGISGQPGFIEGGQFDNDASKYAPLPSGFTFGGHNRWPVTGGAMARMATLADYHGTLASITPGKTKVRGSLLAAQGCSVRATNMDDYDWHPQRGYNLLVPMTTASKGGFVNNDVFFGFNGAWGSGDVAVVQNADDETTDNTPLGSIWASNNDVTTWFPTQNGRGGNLMTSTGSAQTATIHGGMDWKTMFETIPSSDLYHSHPLYIQIEGAIPFNAGGTSVNVQQAIVDVSYFVEIQPTEVAAETGSIPHADMAWDALISIVTDENALPVVSEGHSFFGSLWSGIKKAAGKISSIARTSSSIAALVPVPQVQAAASAVRMGVGVYDQAHNSGLI